MPTLIETYRTAQVLEEQLQKMLIALNREYTPFPDDPSEDVFVAASNAILFMRSLLIDMSRSGIDENIGFFALSLAIELGEFDAFERLFSQEIADIRANDPEQLPAYLNQVRALITAKQPSEKWLQALVGK